MKISSIQQTFLILISFFILFSCESPSGISGHLDGVDGNEYTVYIIQPQSLQEVGASYFGTVIDSAVVQSDGSFQFNNILETVSSELLEIVLQPKGKPATFLEVEDPSKSNYMPIVWTIGERIKISATISGFQKSYAIQGPSEVNESLIKLRDIHQEAFQTHIAGQEWELDDGTQLLDMEQANLEFQQELIQFAQQTEYFLPAMVALRWVSPEGVYERVPEFLVNQCSKWKEEDHNWVIALCQMAAPESLPVLIGDQFPKERLPMVDHDTLSIYDIMGEQLTIIDLWASWCAPCRKENRKVLAPLWDQYHEKGFQIVGYGLESDRNAWIAAIATDRADRWYHASELQGDDSEFLRKLRVQTIPANFILDAQGTVIAKNLHGEELIAFVKGQLDQEY